MWRVGFGGSFVEGLGAGRGQVQGWASERSSEAAFSGSSG